jgi:hypothetical protein
MRAGPVPGSRFQVPGLRFKVYGSRFRAHRATLNFELGTLNKTFVALHFITAPAAAKVMKAKGLEPPTIDQ